MSEVQEAMERAEHAAHAGGGHGHAPDRLGVYIGVTMAILGVLLAFSSALLGAARTELMQKLVEEEHAHAKYQAQDVKHRVAFLALAQTHALAFGSNPEAVNKADALVMAVTVERYLEESVLAKEATVAYEPAIKIHIEQEEGYEHGLLAAEIGIVFASIALMMKRRSVWIASLALGFASMAFSGQTYRHSAHELGEANERIEEAIKKYDAKRVADKTTKAENATLEEVKAWAGAKPGKAEVQP